MRYSSCISGTMPASSDGSFHDPVPQRTAPRRRAHRPDRRSEHALASRRSGRLADAPGETSPTWPSSKRAGSTDATTRAGRARSSSSRPRRTSSACIAAKPREPDPPSIPAYGTPSRLSGADGSGATRVIRLTAASTLWPACCSVPAAVAGSSEILRGRQHRSACAGIRAWPEDRHHVGLVRISAQLYRGHLRRDCARGAGACRLQLSQASVVGPQPNGRRSITTLPDCADR